MPVITALAARAAAFLKDMSDSVLMIYAEKGLTPFKKPLFISLVILLGIYNFSGNMTFIPFFDLTVFKSILPLIDVLLGLGILKEVFRLVFEKYNFKLAAAVTLINVCSVLLIVYIFLPPDIWNAHFVESIRAAKGFIPPVDVDLDYIWRNIPIWFVGISLFGNFVDTIATIAKSIQYSITK